jgi:hypothetical protein
MEHLLHQPLDMEHLLHQPLDMEAMAHLLPQRLATAINHQDLHVLLGFLSSSGNGFRLDL